MEKGVTFVLTSSPPDSKRQSIRSPLWYLSIIAASRTFPRARAHSFAARLMPTPSRRVRVSGSGSRDDELLFFFVDASGARFRAFVSSSSDSSTSASGLAPRTPSLIAPFSSRKSASTSLPRNAASINGDHPSSSKTSTSAPKRSTSSFAHDGDPSLAAIPRRVRPPYVKLRWFTSRRGCFSSARRSDTGRSRRKAPNPEASARFECVALPRALRPGLVVTRSIRSSCAYRSSSMRRRRASR
mmetsp:Transcript_13391/g.56235  ORF Transcript_13391/g.56235 Transcript_13391/m.56235 type:complete len:242 (-) Transcript_13391:276-1001(-)